MLAFLGILLIIGGVCAAILLTGQKDEGDRSDSTLADGSGCDNYLVSTKIED